MGARKWWLTFSSACKKVAVDLSCECNKSGGDFLWLQKMEMEFSVGAKVLVDFPVGAKKGG